MSRRFLECHTDIVAVSYTHLELGRLHSVFPFEHMGKAAGLSDRRLGRMNIFSHSAKIAPMNMAMQIKL